MSDDLVSQRIYLSRLYDLYAPLLSDAQREVFVMHEEQDLSLTEIAEQYHITRQAVSAALCKARGRLCSIESDIGFLHFIEELGTVVAKLDDSPIKKELLKILARKNWHVR